MGELTAEGRRLPLLGFALACFWPTMHNELMYPLSVLYRNTGSLASYPLHILYLAAILIVGATCVGLAGRAGGDRRPFRVLCLVAGACGLLGGVAIVAADPGVSLFADALAGVGAASYAIYFALFFILAFSQLAQTDSRHVMPVIFLSYALFCGVRFACMRLGVLDGGAVQSVLVCALPVVSALALAPLGIDAPAPARSLRQTLRVLPWATLAPTLFFVYLATVGVALFNISASWVQLPETRSIIYLLNFAVCLVAGVVSVKLADSKWLTLGTLSFLAIYLIVAVRLSVALSSGDSLNLGTSPLIASKLAFEVFLLGACAKACNAARKNAAPAAPIALAFMALVVVLPEFFSTDLLLSERYSSVMLEDSSVFIIAGAVPIVVVSVVVALLLQQLARANRIVETQKQKQGRASAEELQQAIAEALDLSPREAEVTCLLCRGQNAKAIADQICLSESTVYAHMKRIYRKLGLHSKQELVDLVAQKVDLTI